MKTKKPKLYKCLEGAKGCFGQGHKWTASFAFSGNKYCCENPSCVLQRTVKLREKADDKKAKAGRAETRKQKQAMKTVRQLLAEAQVYCNRYILLLDDGKPCISCGTVKPVKYDAGHYIAIGSDPHNSLRFHRFNINRQCSCNCNHNLSGNIVEYRKNLVPLIGVKNVEWLENHHDYYRFTREDAIEIKKHFQELIKELKR